MPYNPQAHHRRSIRLQGYDYAQAGLYFITICCQGRARLFGEIVEASLVDAQNDMGAQQKIDSKNDAEARMILNDAGKMIVAEWMNLKTHFHNIELHEFVVMPNHFHGILEIVGAPLVGAQNDNETGQPQGIAPTVTIGNIMDAFKSITTVEYIRGVKTL